MKAVHRAQMRVRRQTNPERDKYGRVHLSTYVMVCAIGLDTSASVKWSHLYTWKARPMDVVKNGTAPIACTCCCSPSHTNPMARYGLNSAEEVAMIA